MLHSISKKPPQAEKPETKPIDLYRSSDHELSRLVFAFIEQQQSEHTRRAYLQTLSRFFSSFPKLKLKQVQVEHVALFKKLLHERYSTATVSQRLACVRAFFRWLAEQKAIETDPARLVRIPKQDAVHGKTPEITDAQVKMLFAAANKDIPRERRDATILYFLYYLGLRRAELLNLQAKHITVEGSYTVLQILGKGNQIRRVPLRPFLLEELEAYQKLSGRDFSNPNTYLFTGCIGHKKWSATPLSGTALLNMVQRMAVRAGIKTRVCVHTARVTATNNALEKGATDSAVMALFGWRARQSLERYIRRRDQLRNNAADRVNY